MNPLRNLCLVACLLTVALAHHGRGRQSQSSNSLMNKWNPSEWVSEAEINALPSVSEVTLKRLEAASVDEGAKILNQLYYLSQVNQVFQPTYAPDANQITGYIVSERGEQMPFNLNTMVSIAKQADNFGNDEVTILITGLPREWASADKAVRKLVQAYNERYNMQADDDADSQTGEKQSSSEENSETQQEQRDKNKRPTGNLVVIELGENIHNFEELATLNIERIGKMLGERLVQLTNQADVPQEIIHLIGQGISAHVAGVAGRQFTRLTGHKLRRITGLDPTRIFAKREHALNGLARGDADFVDAIHTSVDGMGTPKRCGNADFYPNGPAAGVPGADNVVEASMRATRYFAESVRPGNERNFPAVAATSYSDYKQDKGYGPRVYMGIDTDFDVEGDYILQVNAKSPFGKSSDAKRQGTYHALHQSWNTQQNQ